MYRTEGMAGLDKIRQPGTKGLLTEEQLQQVDAAIKSSPHEFGIDTDTWNLRRIGYVLSF